MLCHLYSYSIHAAEDDAWMTDVSFLSLPLFSIFGALHTHRPHQAAFRPSDLIEGLYRPLLPYIYVWSFVCQGPGSPAWQPFICREESLQVSNRASISEPPFSLFFSWSLEFSYLGIVADPVFYFDADPAWRIPAFYFHADPDQTFHFIADPAFYFDADPGETFYFVAGPG
jgi:hypothetical protein